MIVYLSRRLDERSSCLSLWERCPSFQTGAERVFRCRTALSVTAYAVPALPEGEPRIGALNDYLPSRKVVDL